MKTRFWILPCLLLILVLSLAACGEESPNKTPDGPPESVHPFIYVVNEDGETCTIRGVGDITTSKVTIPEKLDDDTIKAVQDQKDKIQTLCYQNPHFIDIVIERCLQNCPIGKK